jgi:hypothetical protein
MHYIIYLYTTATAAPAEVHHPSPTSNPELYQHLACF